jgi:hypothetical protein
VVLWIDFVSMWFRVKSTTTFKLNLGAIEMENISQFCLARKKIYIDVSTNSSLVIATYKKQSSNIVGKC